jgi:TetR/AcrR family transcriptional repressor of nem operon
VPAAQQERLGKGAHTRERILETAASLFHERGINATSLGDVLRAAGVGKGQFYQHFAGREDLVNRVLDRHRELYGQASEPIESWAELRAWMLGYAQRQREAGYLRGCPIGTAGYALQPEQDVPRETIGAIFEQMREQIARFFRTERRAGRLASDANPGALANLTIAAVQGAMILGLVERNPRPVRGVIDQAFDYLTSFAIKEEQS